jgi:outer membrane protein TolC
MPAIDLAESIRVALENNLDMQAERTGLSSVQWQEKNSITSFLPKATFNSAIIRIDEDTFEKANEWFQLPVLDSSGFPTGDYIPFSAGAMSNYYKTTFSNDITIQQPIFNGGKVILGYQLSRLAKEQAEMAVINKEKDLVFAVVSTYMNILKLNDLKKLSEKSYDSTVKRLADIQKKLELGKARKSDLLQWQVKQKNDETALLKINNSISELNEIWKNLLGYSENIDPKPLSLEDFDAEILELSNLTKEEWDSKADQFLNQVRKTSPAINSMKILNRMSQKNLNLAKGNFLPSFNLQFQYQIESDDKFDFKGDDNYSVAALFSLPIFQSGANYTNLKKAKFDHRRTMLQTQWAEANLLVAARSSINDLFTKAQIVQDNKIALDLAQENYKIINDLFEQGLIINSELMDAQSMLFAGEMNLNAAYYDFIIARYELEKYIQTEE